MLHSTTVATKETPKNKEVFKDNNGQLSYDKVFKLADFELKKEVGVGTFGQVF
jgi:hypothetical protein